MDTWLHSFSFNLGSWNSYPHLRNVEKHLDRVIVELESQPATPFTESLNPIEIYLLLSAVLFHDIGRTQPDKEKVGHGELTRRFLTKGYSHLGVPSEEMAKTLARVCAYHDPPKTTSRSEMERELSTTVLDQYGEVRELLLAALLTLADTMDAAFTRVPPRYLTDGGGVGAIGLFRSGIRGVSFDPVARLIRTVVMPEERRSDETDAKADGSQAASSRKSDAERNGDSKYILKPSKDGAWCYRDVRNLLKRIVKEDKKHEATKSDTMANSVLKTLSAKVKGLSKRKWPKRNSNGRRVHDFLKKLEKQSQLSIDLIQKETPDYFSPLICDMFTSRSYRILYWLLSLGLLDLNLPKKDKKEKKKAIRLPADAPLAVLLGNMLDNCETLEDIRDPLASFGILLAGWVVERNEHLYNKHGYETFEPIFSKDYLLRVVEAMWELSVQVFGVSQFPYEELASSLGETDTEKVRRAVRRIAIVTQALPWKWNDEAETDSLHTGAIRADKTRWYWRMSRRETMCCGVPLRNVREKVETLESPNDL